MFDRPPAAVSTWTFASPTLPAGVATVTVVEVNETIVAGVLPKKTRTEFVKFVPVITVEVLPAVVPFVTDRLAMTGGSIVAVTSWERSTFCVVVYDGEVHSAEKQSRLIAEKEFELAVPAKNP